jgi:acyl carrier protein
MDRENLIKLFRTKATEIAEKDFSQLSETSVIAELGIDSLGMLELVGEMERELQVQIPDDELVGIQTVKQLVDLIEKRASAKTA